MVFSEPLLAPNRNGCFTHECLGRLSPKDFRGGSRASLKDTLQELHNNIPIPSMHGISIYIWLIFYGNGKCRYIFHTWMLWDLLQRKGFFRFHHLAKLVRSPTTRRFLRLLSFLVYISQYWLHQLISKRYGKDWRQQLTFMIGLRVTMATFPSC